MTISQLSKNPTEQELFNKLNEIIVAINAAQTSSNLVTSISSSSTDTQYPSAKCVYDLIGTLEQTLHTINSGS